MYLKANPKRRREFFKRYYHWSLKTQDCDPAMFMMNYVNHRMELNMEQRFWFAWLYGNTYNVATAWILFNEFPDFENVDIERLEKWNTDNYRRLRYQVDNKWQKGHLPAMFKSYKAVIQEIGGTQQQFYESLTEYDGKENFNNCYKAIIKKFFKFGRYLAWFYLQTLRETCDLMVEPFDLLLKDSASESHRNGLLYALGLDIVVENEMKLDAETYQLLDIEAAAILEEMSEEFPDVQSDYFSMETTLCAFKKVFREKHGRYLGYYLDRQGEDIIQCQGDGWAGIDWDLLWDARKECIDPRLLHNQVDNKRMGEVLRTGTVQYIDWFSKTKF